MHAPVLLDETIVFLALHTGDFAVDGTLGGGGHAKAILARIGTSGCFLGIDADPDAIARARREIGSAGNVRLVRGNYADLPEILAREKLPKANALLLDLGLSSDQLAEGGRGFSFQHDEPLDMRFGVGRGETAADIIARASAHKLASIFREYGEECNAERFARAIVDARRRTPIRTSGALAHVIERAAGRRGQPAGLRRPGRIHPATKVFMALRIAVNHELENIRSVAERIPYIVRSGGRVVAITFHSLEDRAVKEGFRALARRGAAVLLTKHVVKPSQTEVRENPRSRSAKLRAIQLT
jgi:16S rRNA (cytosine1402-N4)-methyltransferase